MRGSLPFLLALAVGGAVGGWIALSRSHRGDSPRQERTPPAPETAPAPLPPPGAPGEPEAAPLAVLLPPEPSFYLSNLHPGGLDIRGMTPLLLSPKPDEVRSPSCPASLDVHVAKGGYADLILPFLRAVGDLGLDAAGAEPLTAEVVSALEEQWRLLRAVAEGPVGTPPLRIIVRHHPRGEIPGHCVGIQVTVSTIPDPFFDQDLFGPLARNARSGPAVGGVLFDLRKSYQLAGGTPRLIEASLQIQSPVRIGMQMTMLGMHLPDEKARGIVSDPASVAHFSMLGGGERRGIVWCDRSAGMGPEDAWSGAYLLRRDRQGETDQARFSGLTPALVMRLLAVVRSA